MTRLLLIAWAPFSPTFEDIAPKLGGEIVYLTLLFRKKWATPLKYCVLTVRTLRLAHKMRPDVIIVQNPPVFAALAVLLGRFFDHYRVVVDHHCLWSMKTVTWPILSQLVRLLEKAVCRRADENFSPNIEWTRLFQSLGANNCFTYHDYLPLKTFTKTSFHPFTIISAHGSNHRDEMLRQEAEAFETLKDYELFVTGRQTVKSHPVNVNYVGYLDSVDYEHLKENAYAALVLTNEPNTVPHVIHEYLVYGIPTIVLKNDLLRSIFGKALIEADNSRPETIRGLLRQACENRQFRETVQNEIRLNYEKRSLIHEAELARLEDATR